MWNRSTLTGVRPAVLTHESSYSPMLRQEQPRKVCRVLSALRTSSSPECCPALGIPLAVQSKTSDNSPSLDKIIPALGYVPGNIVVVSHLANRIKSNATPAQLLAVAHFYKEQR